MRATKKPHNDGQPTRVEPAALANTMGRLGNGTAPASVIGAIIDRLAELQVTEAAWQDR